MGEWVKALEAKARIIHGQLAAARKLAEEAGLDPDDVAQPYLDLINDLYRDEWQFAQLADEGRTLTFSQREGYDPLPKPLQLGELPGEARTAIWNVLFGHLDRSRVKQDIDVGLYFPIDGAWEVILRAIHVYRNWPLEEWSGRSEKFVPGMRGLLEQEPFNRVFDLIEFIMRHERCPPEFIADVSGVFRRFQLAYIIDSGPPPTIFPATTAAEGNELRRNLVELRTVGLDGCETHLRNASKCINDGDLAGSVRESIHAVESVAKLIAPDATTLGAALHSLERRGVLHHKALKQAISKLYGYTSDEQGIRHALLDKAAANVTIDEAVFMLGACASFASYLWRKHKAADAP